MRSIFFYFILFIASKGHAQGHVEIGAFLGASGYLGDLNKSDWISKESKPAFGVLARYNLTDFIALRLSFLHGQLSGRDSHYADRTFRNFSTIAPITEVTLQAEWHFWPLLQPRLPRNFEPTFSPFLFLGIGLAHTSPKPDLDNMIILKPEFVQGAALDKNATFSSYHAVIPFGAGMKYRPHPQWTFTLEAAFRLTFSDYLDGISHAANPNKPDRYQFWGVTVAHRFRKQPFIFKRNDPMRCKSI